MTRAVLKALIKKIILLLPNGERILAWIIQKRRKPQPVHAHAAPVAVKPIPEAGPADPKSVFTDYYKNNFWGNKESVSGAGSTMEYTENVRRELPLLMERFNVRKFLDAPCGDYNWFQAVKRPHGLEYLGGDIVEELIQQNQIKHGDANTRFILLDIITEALPPADMWMCRDCLFHFSYDDIFKTLANFLRSDIRYLFTSIHTECTVNADIVTGGARQLNLELPPFNLPKALLYVEDWIPGFTVRWMGVWSKEMVAEGFEGNVEIQKMIALKG